MPNCLRRISLCAMLLSAAMVSGLISTGCGEAEPPPSPTSEQYKEAKKRHDAERAKEYGRRSIDDKKATLTPPAKAP